MSLSLGEEVILNQTENACVPTAAKKATKSKVSKTKNEEEDKNYDLSKDVQSILNKITTDNMLSLTERFKALPINTIQRLERTVDLVFEKAIKGQSFAPLCASLCSAVKSVEVNSKDGKTASFQKLIVNKCHSIFDLDKAQEIDSAKKLKEINSCKNPKKKKQLQIKFKKNERRLRERIVGNRRFIGELFKQQIITTNIVFYCIVNLVTKRVKQPLECICNLLKTAGKELEQSFDLNFIFDKLKALTSRRMKSKIPPRIKLMIQDVIDLRRDKWILRSTDSNHHREDDKVIGEENKSHSMFFTPSTRPLEMTNLLQGPQNPPVANMSNAQNVHGQSLIVQSQPMEMAPNTQPMQQVPQQPSTTPMQISEDFRGVLKKPFIKLIDPNTGREIALSNSLQGLPTADEIEKMKVHNQFQSQLQSTVNNYGIKSSDNNPAYLPGNVASQWSSNRTAAAYYPLNPKQASQTAVPMPCINYLTNQQVKSNIEKNMSFSLGEEVILNQTENACVPTAAKKATKSKVSKTKNEEEDKNYDLSKDVQSILNKITTDNMLSLTERFKALPINTIQRLERTVDLVFEKAIKKQSFAHLCASLCSAVKSVEVNSKDGKTASFQKLIVNKCHRVFDLDKAQEIDSAKKLKEINSCKNPKKKKQLQIKFKKNERRLRERIVGNRRFIGELFKQQIITTNIVFYCIVNLVTKRVKQPLECICNLLKTAGKELEQSFDLNFIFDKLKALTSRRMKSKIPPRIKLMIQDVIDLRRDKWILRSTDSNHHREDDKVIGEENKSHSMFFTPSTRPLEMTNLLQGPQNPPVANMSNAQNVHGQSLIVQSQPMEMAPNTQPMQQVPQQPSTTPMQISEDFRGVLKKPFIKLIDPNTGREIALSNSLQGPPTADEIEKMKVHNQFQSQVQSTVNNYGIKSSDNNPAYLPGNVASQWSSNRTAAAYYPLNPKQASQTAVPMPCINYLTNQQVKSNIEKNMSFSLGEEVILNQTENACVPTAAKKATKSKVSKTKNEEEDKNYDLSKDVQSILNKITTDNMLSLTERFKALPINTIQRLERTVDLVFEKAIKKQSFAHLCASLCSAVKSVEVNSKDGKTASFQKLIVNKCRSVFDLDKAREIDSAKKLKEINSCKNPEMKKQLQIKFKKNERRLRERIVGNRRFIGELFKQQIITTNIVFYCIVNLLTKRVKQPLECICNLLKTAGKELEQSFDLNIIFDKLKALTSRRMKSKIPTRITLMIQDVIDLRRDKWILRSTDSNHHREDDKVIGEENKSHSMFFTPSTRPLEMTNLLQGPQNPPVANMSNAQNVHGQSLIVQSQPMEMAPNTQPMQQVPQQPSTTPMQISEDFRGVLKKPFIKLIDPNTGREIALSNSLQGPPTADEIEKMKVHNQFQSQVQSTVNNYGIKSSDNNPAYLPGNVASQWSSNRTAAAYYPLNPKQASQTAVPMPCINYLTNQQVKSNIEKNMSFSLGEEVILNQTENACVPTAAKKATKSKVSKTKNEEEDKNYDLSKDVQSILNKITTDNMLSLTERFKALPINTIQRLERTVDLVFEKAIKKQSFAHLCASLCSAVKSVEVNSKDGKTASFQKLIVNKCRSVFDLDKAREIDSAKKLKEINSCKNPEMKKQLQIKFKKNERRLRERIVGNRRFIGELFKQQIITTNIVFYCIVNLLTKRVKQPLECICNLLKTAGKELEQSFDLNIIFDKLKALTSRRMKSKIPTRITLMIQDVIDLRRDKWILRSTDSNHHREDDKVIGEENKSHSMFFTPSTRPLEMTNLLQGPQNPPVANMSNAQNVHGQSLIVQSQPMEMAPNTQPMQQVPQQPSTTPMQISEDFRGVLKKPFIKLIDPNTGREIALSNSLQGPPTADEIEKMKVHNQFQSQVQSTVNNYGIKSSDNNPAYLPGNVASQWSSNRTAAAYYPLNPKQASQTAVPMPCINYLTNQQVKSNIEKNMSFSLGEEVILNQTENACVPTAAKKATKSKVSKTKNEEEDKNYDLSKDVQSILNKITTDNMLSLTERFKALPINTIQRLERTVDLVFEKAIKKQSFAHLCASLCSAVKSVEVNSKDGKTASFQKLIVNKCRSVFDLDKAREIDSAKKLKEINSCKNPEMKKQLQIKFKKNERRLRERIVGNRRFIGELFKQQIITTNIVFYCIVNLLTKRVKQPLECICNLLKTAGKELEQSFDLNIIFDKLKALTSRRMKSKIPTRITLMIQDVIDLRRDKWILRSTDSNHHREDDKVIGEENKSHSMFFTPSTRPLEMTNLLQGPQNPPVANMSNAQNVHGQSLIVQSQPMEMAPNTQPMQQVPQQPSTTPMQISEDFRGVLKKPFIKLIDPNTGREIALSNSLQGPPTADEIEKMKVHSQFQSQVQSTVKNYGIKSSDNNPAYLPGNVASQWSSNRTAAANYPLNPKQASQTAVPMPCINYLTNQQVKSNIKKNMSFSLREEVILNQTENACVPTAAKKVNKSEVSKTKNAEEVKNDVGFKN